MAEIAIALAALSFCGKFAFKKMKKKIVSHLTDGDLLEQKFRDMIIEPLDEINEKLADITKAELKLSVQYLKQGMIVLDQRILKVSRQKEMEKATLKQAEPSDQINSKIISETSKSLTPGEDDHYFEKARNEFELSAQHSLRAMSYIKALTLSERVYATRLNIVANILRNIDDVPVSLALCKHTLIELNSLEEIVNNFNVHFRKKKGGQFKKKERTALIQSVANINRMVWDYAHFCQADDDYFTKWPLISLDDEHQLHPVLDYGIREICGEREIATVDDSYPRSLSVTESGTFLVATKDGAQAILPNGLIDCVYRASPRRATETPFDVKELRDLAVKPLDDDIFYPTCAVSVHDKIFVSSNCSCTSESDLPAVVYVYDSKGSLQYGFGYYIFTAESRLTSMALNANNELLVVDDHTNSLHAFTLYGAYLGKRASWKDHYGHSHIAVTPDNRVFKTHGSDTIRIYDIDHDNCCVKRQISISENAESLYGIAYDSVGHKLYVLVELEDETRKVMIYDEDLFLEGEIKLFSDCHWQDPTGIAVTPTGLVAILTDDSLVEI